MLLFEKLALRGEESIQFLTSDYSHKVIVQNVVGLSSLITHCALRNTCNTRVNFKGAII